MKFYRSHLHTGQQPGDAFDVDIIFDTAVLLRNWHLFDMLSETAGMMFLEKAFFCPALRTTDKAQRTMSDPRQHQPAHSFIIICQIPFGRLRIREYYPVAAGNFHFLRTVLALAHL